jgi:hypothetical protein
MIKPLQTVNPHRRAVAPHLGETANRERTQNLQYQRTDVGARRIDEAT